MGIRNDPLHIIKVDFAILPEIHQTRIKGQRDGDPLSKYGKGHNPWLPPDMPTKNALAYGAPTRVTDHDQDREDGRYL